MAARKQAAANRATAQKKRALAKKVASFTDKPSAVKKASKNIKSMNAVKKTTSDIRKLSAAKKAANDRAYSHIPKPSKSSGSSFSAMTSARDIAKKAYSKKRGR